MRVHYKRHALSLGTPKASAFKHTNVQAIPGVPSPTKASKPTEANSPVEAVTKPEQHSTKEGEKSLCCMSLVGLSVVFPGNTSCSSISWVQLTSQGRVHGLTLAQLPASCLATSQWPCLCPLSAFDHALPSSLPRNAVDFTQHLCIKTAQIMTKRTRGRWDATPWSVTLASLRGDRGATNMGSSVYTYESSDSPESLHLGPLLWLPMSFCC